MNKREKICYIAAMVLLPAGAFCSWVFTPVRFTGFLCFCAAAVMTVFGLLTRWAGTYAWAKWARRALLVLVAAGFIFFAVLEVWVVSWARTDDETDVSAVIVLGAGVNGTTPSLSLAVRLQAALDYVAERPDIPIIVTGAQGPGEAISEARCMADWLIAHGVAADRIWLEEQATDTVENIRYSKELLVSHGMDPTANYAVVTSDYHLCRAAYLWRLPYMVPVAAHMPGRYWPLTVNYYIREAFAMASQLVF